MPVLMRASAGRTSIIAAACRTPPWLHAISQKCLCACVPVRSACASSQLKCGTLRRIVKKECGSIMCSQGSLKETRIVVLYLCGKDGMS